MLILRYVSFLALIFLSGCGQSEADKDAVSDAKLKSVGEKYIKARLKDPESAQFQGQFIGIKGVPCGQVNSKNSFGGYTGFKRYIVGGVDLAIMEADMPPGEFDKSWAQFCK